MRFLTRLLKTPDQDQEEDQDEFDAEENGLLMVQALSGDKEGTESAGTPEADALRTEIPAAEGEPANPPSQGEVRPTEAEAEPLFADGGEPPAPAEESPPAETETPETVAEEAQTEQESSDDPLSLFRGAAKRIQMSPGLRADLQDVSAAELLAAARSVRNSLLGGQAASGAGQRNEKAA
jgi:hypothetical protein